MSSLDDSDLAAQERDVAAAARDRAAESREAALAADTARNRVSAAQDRAASALDRKEAALALHGAAQLLRNAYRDDLTGVLSRDAGRDQLGQALDRAHRTGEPLVIAFVDVDHLKRVNDAHGHAHGDGLLRELGSALRRSLRSYDILVRYGGDEFVCGLVGSLLAPAESRFSDVARAFSRAIPGASISIGLAELREGESVDDVIDRADHNMYERRSVSRTADH
jgi:diguanylate cyclase (GGDEF)-like protein